MWEPNHCHVCGNEIPQVGKTGHQLSKWSYEQRKTCGSSTCYGIMQTSKRSVPPPYELQAIDYFLMGKPYVS